MYIQLYALYIETCITSNMYIQLYALYIEERQGVRIQDDSPMCHNRKNNLNRKIIAYDNVIICFNVF